MRIYSISSVPRKLQNPADARGQRPENSRDFNDTSFTLVLWLCSFKYTQKRGHVTQLDMITEELNTEGLPGLKQTENKLIK